MSRRHGDPPKPCNKRRFSKEKAAGVVKKARRSPNNYRQEQRVYFCQGCECWHTTRSPFTTAAQRRAQREAE